jgi:hypothetical protein
MGLRCTGRKAPAGPALPEEEEGLEEEEEALGVEEEEGEALALALAAPLPLEGAPNSAT